MSDQIFYSHNNGGFYSTAIHGENIPRSAVEITAAKHAELIAGLNAGKAIKMEGLTPVLTDRQIPIPDLQNRAIARVSRMHGEFTRRFTAGLPQETVAAWSTKASHARKHLAGESSPLIAAEAAESGEDPDALAARIAGMADAYEMLIVRLDGIRSATLRQINAATTAAAIDAALTGMADRLAALAD